MFTVRVGIIPVLGESLPGLIVRLAERTRFRGADRLAAMGGFRQPGSAASSSSLDRLAGLAGLDAGLLEGMSYRPTRRLAHCRFGAGELHREFLDISERRFCPTCLGERPYHRAAWDLAMATACPEHRVRLALRCPACNRKAGWKHPIVARCPCGGVFSSSNPVPVTEVEAEANAKVFALSAGLEVPWLPECLRGCARPDLLRIMMGLGMFLTDWKGQRRIEAMVASGPDRAAAILIAGVQCLVDWPVTLHGYLDQVRKREGSRPGRYGARKALGSFYGWLHVLEHTAARDALVEATKAYVGNDEVLASRVHRSELVAPDGGRAATGLIGLNEAASALGRSGQGVRRLMTEGLLPFTTIEGRGVPSKLDRAAVTALADGTRTWVPMRGLAAMLGVSRARTARVVQAGLLRPVHGGPADGWATWSFDSGHVESLLGRLGRGLQQGTADADFNHVAEAFRRRGVGIEGVLERILDGSLLVRAIRTDAVGLGRLAFSRIEVRRVCRALERKHGRTMTRQATAERLGVKWEVVAHLIRRGLLAQAGGEIKVNDVERFEQEFVFGRTLATVVNTSPRHVADRLSRMGIHAVVGPGVDGSRQNVFRKADVGDLDPSWKDRLL